MFRSLFLAFGIFLVVLGIESTLIDQATLNNPNDQGPTEITVVPADWVPWGLIAAGAVTILYSYTLPQKFKGG